MRNPFSHSTLRSETTFKLNSLFFALFVGIVLGLIILAVTPIVFYWSEYMLALASIIGLVFLGMFVVGDVRRVLLVSLVLTIPLNLAFDPLGDVQYHAGGASAGVILYPYDFPLMGLIILMFFDTLGKKKTIYFSNIDVAAILLIIWSTLSIYNSSHIQLSVFQILRMAKLYLLSRVVASNIKNRSDVQDVLIALLIGITFESVISIFQYTVGIDLGLGLYTVGNLRRVSGTVGWPNTFGTYSATILSIGLALWILDNHGKLRILIGAACIAGFFPLFLSFSRGAWISMLAGITTSLLLGWRATWLTTRNLLKVAVIVLSAVMVGALFGGSIITRLTEVQTGMAIIIDRIKLNQVALNMIGTHPLLGVGINTFVDVMRQYDSTGVTWYFPQPVHNVFLLVAAETGLVGLGLFLLLILIVFREGLRAIKTDDRFLSSCAIGILSSLVVLMVSNLADDHLRTDVLYTLFWLLIGLFVALKRMKVLSYHSRAITIEQQLEND